MQSLGMQVLAVPGLKGPGSGRRQAATREGQSSSGSASPEAGAEPSPSRAVVPYKGPEPAEDATAASAKTVTISADLMDEMGQFEITLNMGKVRGFPARHAVISTNTPILLTIITTLGV